MTNSASDKPAIRLELLSNPSYLAGARELISGVSKRIGFDDLACSQVALAVDEALCNIIRHGYECDESRPIWVSIWPNPDGAATDDQGRPLPSIRIVIEDEAKQVELEQIKGRDLEDIRPGGLGVHIIKEVMDEVTFEKRDGAGMRLTLVKKQTPPDQADSQSEGAA